MARRFGRSNHAAGEERKLNVKQAEGVRVMLEHYQTEVAAVSVHGNRRVREGVGCPD